MQRVRQSMTLRSGGVQVCRWAVPLRNLACRLRTRVVPRQTRSELRINGFNISGTTSRNNQYSSNLTSHVIKLPRSMMSRSFSGRNSRMQPTFSAGDERPLDSLTTVAREIRKAAADFLVSLDHLLYLRTERHVINCQTSCTRPRNFRAHMLITVR